MPYSSYTADQVALQIGTLLDDKSELYWTRAEKFSAINEALRVWGALTQYWRTRGTWNVSPGDASLPYYDLSQVLSTLRSRVWTLGQMVQEIQWHLLEAAPGDISGTGMSGQCSVAQIIDAVQRARNRFVVDTHLPYQVARPPGTILPNGIMQFEATAVYLHRVSWQDNFSGTWVALWREDSWAFDHSALQWTVQPAPLPTSYSESELSPLELQIYPIPQAPGTVEVVSAEATLALNTASSTFGIPDEWAHAIKYGALQILYSADNQINDPLRSQYCSMRYDQASTAAQDAKSILRLLCNGVPLPIDSLASIDASQRYWRNQMGPPSMAGVLGDLVVLVPGLPDTLYGLAADVAQPAPLATQTPFIQIGNEDIATIVNYAVHYLLLKCGGKEFQASFERYDTFMKAVEQRGAINKAKVRYLRAAFDQSQVDQALRPDAMVMK